MRDAKRRKIKENVQACWACFDQEQTLVHFCGKGHGLCLDCLQNSCADEIPMVCQASNCGVHIDSKLLVDSFPVDIRHEYENKMVHALARAAAKDGELTKRCPHCPYMEVDDLGTAANSSFQCKNWYCCYYAAPPSEVQRAVDWLEEALIATSCPGCKHSNELDWGCTQMHCTNCNCKYCYVCDTIFESEFDLHGGYHQHYEESLRCARMIEEYYERDPSWPQNTEETKQKFHAIKIQSKIHNKREEDVERFKLAISTERGKAFLRDAGIDSPFTFEVEHLPMGFSMAEPEDELLPESYDTALFSELVMHGNLEGLKEMLTATLPLQPRSLIFRAVCDVYMERGMYRFREQGLFKPSLTIETLQYLLELGGDLEFVDARMTDKSCLLVTAASEVFETDVMRWLLDNNASINATDRSGLTALHHTVQHNSKVDKAQLLLDRGANPNARSSPLYLVIL